MQIYVQNLCKWAIFFAYIRKKHYFCDPNWKKTMQYVATIGFFDGVHRGHKYLLDRLKAEATSRGMRSAAVTFDVHPETVLHHREKRLLSTLDERLSLLKSTGVDEIMVYPFEDIQDLTADAFMEVLHARGVQVLLMGYDHRFGRRRRVAGDSNATELGCTDAGTAATAAAVEIVKVQELAGEHVSSSAIRKALVMGEIEKANEMLGYSYSLTGEVVHGNGIGQSIGFPTANIALPANKLLPAEGVYAAAVATVPASVQPIDEFRSVADTGVTPAVVNIGKNPTVGGKAMTVEVHIVGYSGNLYGQTLTIKLLHRLRGEQKFNSLEELRTQIQQDILRIDNN